MSVLKTGYTGPSKDYLTLNRVDNLPPFLMNIVSDGDFWLFAGSNGTLTAGRGSPDQALFPYETADKLLRFPLAAGSSTAIRIDAPDGAVLWEPWLDQSPDRPAEQRLHKHVHGCALCFEEQHTELELNFRWEWTACEPYGLVRICTLENSGAEPRTLRILDGLNRMLPAGVSKQLYDQYSYLAQGYMRHERLPGIPMAVYTLNAPVSDRAEAAEELRTAAAACLGIEPGSILLCSEQTEHFRAGRSVSGEDEIRGRFGAFLTEQALTLQPGETRRWIYLADTRLDHAALTALKHELQDPAAMTARVEQAVCTAHENLKQRIAKADGLQQTADRTACTHHFANVLYNCMRGGTFADGGAFPSADFKRFVETSSRPAAQAHGARMDQLPERVTLEEVKALAAETGDPQLVRLANQYLPLTFSRRHGDPSRPWNRFDIRVKNDRGEPVYAYQGNWRDIFQNWESLARSHPAFISNMITLFLNASTADGYNPYRITSEGIDWEVPEPDNPWSNIGYWGDHQIIYLLRLLETQEQHYPGLLAEQLSDRHYAYARVPYRQAGFDAIRSNPRDTIAFDTELHRQLMKQAEEIGADGKLIQDLAGNVQLVSLAEKLLVPLLAKISNLVPGGGIWLNTQRPEWNDANNALAGYGLSVVTVCHLRRALVFLQELFGSAPAGRPLQLAYPTAALMQEITRILAAHDPQATAENPEPRLQMLTALGRAGENHRRQVYKGCMEARAEAEPQAVLNFLQKALEHIEAALRLNARGDGLYHSYNLLVLKDGTAEVKHLDLMLEGQVSALSSGLLSGEEALRLCSALRSSPLYREDQHSYLLYPDREITPVLKRNILPADAATRCPLITELIKTGGAGLVAQDAEGELHFCGDLANEADVQAGLNRLAAQPAFAAAVSESGAVLLELWEELFHHHAFTGRSSRFFAFEGLGSIYWHMIAKLLLAVQEICLEEQDPDVQARLAEAYEEIRSGLGFCKTPEQYGAFPTDPYSHTPAHIGAQQPGMTGQVKEEILTRLAELGVVVKKGCITFNPALLKAREFSTEPITFSYPDGNGTTQDWELPADSLGFTLCQVPIVLTQTESGSGSITLHQRGGREQRIDGLRLDAARSRGIFNRTDETERIQVRLPVKR